MSSVNHAGSFSEISAGVICRMQNANTARRMPNVERRMPNAERRISVSGISCETCAGPSAKRGGHESKGKTYSTDRENEVSKIFIISLLCV